MSQEFSQFQEEGKTVVEQVSGPEMSRQEVIAMCHDIAASQGTPRGSVIARLSYSPKDKPYMTGFVPKNEEETDAIQDIIAAAVRRMDRLGG